MSSQSVRVLIIDDHAAFRAAARELLEQRRFAVVAEADGATSGLEAAERVAPDAVLLDIGLQDGNGFDVCHALTQGNPELAVLLVSADEPRDHRARIRECGARGFLLKSRLPSADLVGLLNGAGPRHHERGRDLGSSRGAIALEADAAAISVEPYRALTAAVSITSLCDSWAAVDLAAAPTALAGRA
jgi:CheY-like chemotaxis protein